MLSIVKMDLDNDSGSLDSIDEAVIKEEVEAFPIKLEPILDEDVLSFNTLELKPIVYTTRLDDMTVLKSNLLSLHPQDVTEKILEESKPKLYINPIKADHRSSKKSFRSVKTKLHQIYHENWRINLEEELDIKPDIQLLPIDPSLIKNEVPGEPNSNCKFSEILNQCRPCSIKLSKINFFQSKLTLKGNRREIEIWAEVLKENGKKYLNKVNKSTVPKSVLHRPRGKKMEKVQRVFTNFSCHRLLTNGLMEIPDPYSDALNAYGTDPRGQLIDFYTDSAENADKYDHIRTVAEARLTFKSCCWVRRDEYIQSLYPKVLLYATLRFMKTPHLCPPGKCVCCCKKKQHFDKPDIDFTEDVSLPNPRAYLKPDEEIKALENEIQSNMIKTNKTPGLNSSEWLRNLLSRPGAELPYNVGAKGPVRLIDKALTYKPPVPKKQYDNRRLLTIKQETTKSGGIIVFRNFACDEREIYELNSNGELQSYTKSTCFNNKSELNVKKMLQKSKSVHDVCCWFKRENVITELLCSKSLHPSAVKFIRSRHTCLSEKCNCCCQPNYDRVTTLTDVAFPSGPNYRASLLKGVSDPKQPITISQAAAVVPSTVGMKVVLPTMSVAKPTINSSLVNLYSAYIHPTHIPPAPAASTSSFEPVPGPSSIIKTTTKNDDDCEIVSVTPASTMPTQTNSVPTEQVKYIPEMVNCDDISKEVNSTIASILERFKDVRLTINSTGKVTAAINTPINTLSTVEIKVLASILSYAQSQVNLLGIHSDMSLSSFISQSANMNNITQPESSSKTSENNFKTNSQIHPQSSDVSNNSINNKETTNCVGYSNALPQMQLPPRTDNVFEHFSISASVKNQGFNDSFASFLATKSENSTNIFKPVIANVFSLKDQIKTATATQNDTSTSTVWYRKPGSQTSSVLIADKTNKYENVSKKRYRDNTEKTPKRLRVLSPSKLGAPTVDEPNKIMNTFYKPIQVLNPKAQQDGNRTGIVPAFNPKPVPVVSGKSLVVAPLSTANADANVVREVTVPVTVDSESLEVLPIEMSLAQAYDEAPLDDDCILGM